MIRVVSTDVGFPSVSRAGPELRAHAPHPWRRLGGTLLALCTAAACVACDGTREPTPYPPRTPTAGKAVLPPTPDLDPPRPIAQYEDGAWSVAGVFESTTAGRAAESISVRGYVAAVRPCPDREKGCSPAPHIQLCDREDLQGRRLLAGGMFDVERDGITVGKQVTLKGRIRSNSPDGVYFAPGGVLLLDAPAEPADSDEPAEK